LAGRVTIRRAEEGWLSHAGVGGRGHHRAARADDPALQEIAAQLGPLTATSANRSGAPEAQSAAEVRAQLGDAVDAIVDGPIAQTRVIDRSRLRRSGTGARPAGRRCRTCGVAEALAVYLR